jgi:hypothetical protein
VRALVDFSWTADDDAGFLQARELYQFENAAAMYFGELLGYWLEEQPTQYPLTTKVAIADQIGGLSPTGERLEFRLPSTVDLTYIGEEEIPTLAATLTNITKGQETPAYEALKRLVNSSPPSSFLMSFKDPPLEPSTFLYMVEENESSGPQTAIIVACALASAALFLASLILLWAIGACDNLKPCKNLRARFFMHSDRPEIPDIPYGVKTKPTSDETVDGNGNIGANSMYTYDEEDFNQGAHGGGFEVTPTRGVFRIDELASPDSVDSQTSDDMTNFTEFTPGSTRLGIISMNKPKGTDNSSLNVNAMTSRNTMSPESILADIQTSQVDHHLDVD